MQTTVNKNKFHLEPMKSHELYAETARDQDQAGYLSICWDGKTKMLSSEERGVGESNSNIHKSTGNLSISLCQCTSETAYAAHVLGIGLAWLSHQVTEVLNQQNI